METVFTLAPHSKITRFFILATALAVSVGLLSGVPVSLAHAEAGSVRINAIGTKTAPYHGKYQISANYTAVGDARVDSATVTVQKGHKTVATNASVAKLAPGKYTVTQKVTYRPFTAQTHRQLVADVGTWINYYGEPFKAGPCTITSAPGNTSGTWTATCTISRASTGVIGTVETGGTWEVGPSNPAPNSTLYNDLGQAVRYNVGVPPTVGLSFAPAVSIKTRTALYETITDSITYGASTTITKTQALTIKAGRKDCATNADYKKVKTSLRLGRGDSVKKVAKRLFSKGTRYHYEVISGHTVEGRIYPMCSTTKIIAVAFVDAHAAKKGKGYN